MAGDRTVRCPHCGAENPRSLLVTMCQECRGDLSQTGTGPSVPARPAPIQPPIPASPPVPHPLPRAATAETPPCPPPLPDERGVRPPAYQLKPIPPDAIDYRDQSRRSSQESPAVGIAICLFAIAAFAIGLAVVLWLSR